MRMTYESMMLFAETWIAAWNRRDIDAVLAHFADEAQFVADVLARRGLRRALEKRSEPPAAVEMASLGVCLAQSVSHAGVLLAIE